MSDSNGPVRRRRIAGEAPPAAPAKKPAAKKPATTKGVAKKLAAKKAAPPKTAPAEGAAQKAAVKKAAAKKVATPAVTPKKAPAKKAPAAQAAATTTPVAKTPVAKTPAAKTPVSKAGAPAAPRVGPATRPATPKVPVRTPASSDSAGVPRAARSRPSRRDLLLVVPATLVAVAALVVGVWFVVSPPGQADSPADLATSERQASSAAASAAETIFSFRYDELDQHLKASKALMTPKFATEFDKIAPALTELAPQRKIVVEAVARESAALPCGDDCSSSKAEVLVFVDQARLVGDSTEPTVFANRIKVSMVKSGDGWRVADIRAL